MEDTIWVIHQKGKESGKESVQMDNQPDTDLIGAVQHVEILQYKNLGIQEIPYPSENNVKEWLTICNEDSFPGSHATCGSQNKPPEMYENTTIKFPVLWFLEPKVEQNSVYQFI